MVSIVSWKSSVEIQLGLSSSATSAVCLTTHLYFKSSPEDIYFFPLIIRESRRQGGEREGER